MTMSQAIAAARWLRRRADNVAVVLLSVMFACFIAQIFFRYVLNDPLGWTEEVIITAWLWTVLWGAAFTLSEREEIRFDIVYSNVPERVRRVFTVVTGVVLIALYGISLPAAWSYVTFMKVEHSAYLRVPLDWLYSIYLVFAVASIVRYIALVWRAIRGGATPQTDPAALGD